MDRLVVFDVYGRFVIHAEQSENGGCRFYRPGTDGKRGRIFDVVVQRDATLDEIENQPEAIYHEWGRIVISEDAKAWLFRLAAEDPGVQRDRLSLTMPTNTGTLPHPAATS